jgi:CRISPR-associated protein Cmr5
MSETRIKTLTQERAQKAWEFVKEINSFFSLEKKKNYNSWAQKVPALILTNGLGQTLAFLKAKGKNDSQSYYQKLYEHISLQVTEEMDGIAENDLLEKIVNDWDSSQYRRATGIALAFCTWLKRFARATLPDKDEKRDEEKEI